ncbi:MAG: hypothetical protein ACYC0X_30245 [Pirellulaceae bacterium]
MSFAPRTWRTIVLGSLTAAFWALSAFPAQAERPSAPKLLPKKTLAYVRVADSRELAEDFMKTSVGRLSQDEKIKPLILHLYGSATQAFSQIQDELGVSLGEILSIPQGEIWAAVVGSDQGEPAIVVLVEVGENMPVVRKLLDRAEQEAVKAGNTKRTEEAEGVTLTIFDDKATVCEREGAVLFGSDPALVKEILRTWTGDEGAETLAENREFTAIMSRSLGTKDERPQVTWYVDPVELFKNLSRENAGGQMALAMLPVLGLDGVKGAGGSMIYATEEFDSIAYIHLLLDSPRSGVLELIALQAGDTSPEAWVPPDAASYMTVNWDAQKTIEGIRKLFDQFNGEKALSNAIERRVSGPLGVDFEKNVIGQIDDRFTHVSWFEKPARVNSGTNLVGVKLVDAAGFQSTLDKMVAKAGSAANKKNYRGITYYQFQPRRGQQDIDESLIRRPSPSVAIVGDHLLLSDSSACLEAAIAAKHDASKSLSDELDFKLIASRIEQRLGSARPAMIAFQRPEETMRSFYELATSPATRRRLEEAAPSNPAFRALNDALKANPLPPFAAIAKYLAPGGGMMVSDETGIHYTAFALKRD